MAIKSNTKKRKTNSLGEKESTPAEKREQREFRKVLKNQEVLALTLYSSIMNHHGKNISFTPFFKEFTKQAVDIIAEDLKIEFNLNYLKGKDFYNSLSRFLFDTSVEQDKHQRPKGLIARLAHMTQERNGTAPDLTSDINLWSRELTQTRQVIEACQNSEGKLDTVSKMFLTIVEEQEPCESRTAEANAVLQFNTVRENYNRRYAKHQILLQMIELAEVDLDLWWEPDAEKDVSASRVNNNYSAAAGLSLDIDSLLTKLVPESDGSKEGDTSDKEISATTGV